MEARQAREQRRAAAECLQRVERAQVQVERAAEQRAAARPRQVRTRPGGAPETLRPPRRAEAREGDGYEPGVRAAREGHEEEAREERPDGDVEGEGEEGGGGWVEGGRGPEEGVGAGVGGGEEGGVEEGREEEGEGDAAAGEE